MTAKKNYEKINANITATVTKTATETGSVTEGEKRLVGTRTIKHPLDVHLITKIQFANKLMRDQGDDIKYASDADIALQDDYAGMMAYLHADDECGDWHPYFNNRNASDYNPDAK